MTTQTKHKTGIEWTHMPDKVGRTWNPITGCTKVSPGCAHCYAETMAKRFHRNGGSYLPGEAIILTHDDRLENPFGWKQPSSVFVNSVSDLFHEEVPFMFVDRVFAVMALTPQHLYMILTKRPERMADYLNTDGTFANVYQACSDLIMSDSKRQPTGDSSTWPLSNVWLGTSVENQVFADIRQPYMEQIAEGGWLTWVSYEPALKNVDWAEWDFMRWLVSGGESGPKARPTAADWHRNAQAFCAENGIPFFFKQWGAWIPTDQSSVDRPIKARDMTNRRKIHKWPDGEYSIKLTKTANGNLLDGRQWTEWPDTGSRQKGVE